MPSQKMVNKKRKEQLSEINEKLDAILELLTAKPKPKAKRKPKASNGVPDELVSVPATKVKAAL